MFDLIVKYMIRFCVERDNGGNLGRVIFVDLKREIGIKM
jgi:hypothetical protein